MHKPAGIFKNFKDYLSEETNPECDEPDDYRTDEDDYGDYLRDRSMDRQHELAEQEAGAR